jgi:hypothetical protein
MPVPPPGVHGPFALSDPDELRAALADFARARARAAVRPYATSAGLAFPGVTLVATGERAA